MKLSRVVSILCVLGLLAVCVAAVAVKVHNSTTLPWYNPTDGDNYYWTENAFHFRHARLVSQGQPIPALDTIAQYPEGTDTARYLTPLMDRVYGRVHRWFFSDVPLHTFLIYAVAIFSTLAVVACFFAARALWQSDWLAFVCAALYALAPASYGRSTGSYLREDFALPFLFGSIACFLICMRRERWWVGLIGAALLVVGMAGWHMSEFFVQLFVVAMAVTLVLYDRGKLPRLTFTIYMAALLVAGLLLAVLRAKYYAVSMAMMIGYAMLIAWWALPAGWSRYRFIAVMVALVLVFAGGAQWLAQVTGTQTHVFAVLLAKVKYLGQLPQDPSVLSFEAKSMWTSSFVSPPLMQFVMMVSTTLLFAIIGVAALLPALWRRRVEPAVMITLVLAAITLVLFLMFTRLSVFAIFFMALLAGAGWPRRWQTAGKPRLLPIALSAAFVVLFAASMGFEFYKFNKLKAVPYRGPLVLVQDVTRWLEQHTDPDDAVVSAFELGPSIATYANRPVLIHSKFESKLLRDKIERIYSAIFGDEQAFYELMREYNARYVVWQSEMIVTGPGGVPYSVGFTSLPGNSAAFGFHFAPQRMRHFQLVHQNASYRIYRVVDSSLDRWPIPPLPTPPVFDLTLYTDDVNTAPVTHEQIWRARARVQELNMHLTAARQFVEQQRWNEAVVAYRYAIHVHPRNVEALMGLTQVMMRLNRPQQAAEALALAIKLDPQIEPDYRQPWEPGVLFMFGLTKVMLNDFVSGEQLFRRTLLASPGEWAAHMYLGLCLSRQNQLVEAELSYREAIRLNPRSYQTYELLGNVYANRGEYAKAIAAVERSLELEPNQPQLREILQHLRTLK